MWTLLKDLFSKQKKTITAMKTFICIEVYDVTIKFKFYKVV